MAKTIRQDLFSWLDNTLTGNDTEEEFRGGDGDDVVWAGGGDDWVRGQGDDDILFGDGGEDVIDGGSGNDKLHGGADHDELNGGSGDDTLYFSGEDAYNGGDDFDTFNANDFLETLTSEPGLLVPNFSASGDEFPAEEGIRLGLVEGIAEHRGTASATSENYYGDGIVVPGMGTGAATFSSIEKFSLTRFGDYFAGDSSSDIISALGGADVIEGRGGADNIDGGEGSDTIEFGSSAGAVNVDLVRGTGLMNDAQGDTYASIENIRGSASGDALYGDGGVNVILARGGNDFVEGRGGADTLDGGSGIDEAMYASSGSSIDVNLTRTTQLGGDAQGDRLANFENVSGTAFGDRLRGDDGNNKLSGLGGSDTIDGGHGDDILIGGDGVSTDTVSFESWDFTLSVTLPARISLGEPSGAGEATLAFRQITAGFQFTNVLERDQLLGFENVRGSNLNEFITGNGEINVLEGRGGNDTIDGGDGNDILVGGAGVDTLIGGGDSDTFKFSGAADMPIAGYVTGNIDSIRDFQDSGLAQDVIDLSAIRTFAGGRLFLNDGDANAYELGEVMTFTNAAGRTEITADLDGNGSLDFAFQFDRAVTTLDSGDFIF